MSIIIAFSIPLGLIVAAPLKMWMGLRWDLSRSGPRSRTRRRADVRIGSRWWAHRVGITRDPFFEFPESVQRQISFCHFIEGGQYVFFWMEFFAIPRDGTGVFCRTRFDLDGDDILHIVLYNKIHFSFR